MRDVLDHADEVVVEAGTRELADERRRLRRQPAKLEVTSRPAGCGPNLQVHEGLVAASEHDIQLLKAHWTEVCLRRIQRPRASDWLGYNVVSVSAPDLERIREILRASFREIRAIATASNPVQSVALLNLQLVTWPDQ